MNYKERLGNKIKEMRTNLGESAEEFGKRFDPVASRANISSWESGKYLPNGKRLKVIADMHGTTITKLLYDETKQEKLFGVYETFFNQTRGLVKTMKLKFRVYDRYLDTMHKVSSLEFGCGGASDVRVFHKGYPTHPDLEDYMRLDDGTDRFIFMQALGFTGYYDADYYLHSDDEEDVYMGDVITIFHEEWVMGYYQELYTTGIVEFDDEAQAAVIKVLNKERFGEKIPDRIDGSEISYDDILEDEISPLLGYFDLEVDDITIHGNVHTGFILREWE